MSLTVGAKLGAYEILGALGAGGMGEVYRARDTRLGRDVAVKILPQQFAQDLQRLARFEREAQLLAALNHPHIAHIYGLEETSGTRALVMELVEGPTLADQIAHGPYLLEEALRIARQVAEGLEYAHDRGIIHRDLKPANVKLTTDGNVKILDFGLAKALEGEPAATDISHSPTLTAAATQAGIVLGTAAYMSPEQAKGKATDRRADIWSFGVLLYEMLAGKKLYEADTAQETLAAVLIKEPSLDSLPPTLPPRLRGLLRRCLTKDSRARLQAIGEARIILEEIAAHPEGTPEETEAARAAAAVPAWQRLLPWGIAAAAIVLAGIAAWAPWRPAPQPAAPMRLSVELGADASLYSGPGSAVALSPDGMTLAFTAQPGKGGPTQLFLRRLDRAQATPIAGTDDVRDPFFSPDGQWVAFFANNKLKKVSVTGGGAVTLCDAPSSRGGDWGEDGNIVLAATNRAGLSRVPAAGGTPTELTKLDQGAGENTHRWPHVLPGAKAVIFTAHTIGNNFQDANVIVQSLETGQRRVLQHGGMYARYLPAPSGGHEGHLLYMHDNTLFAAPFDAERLEVTGTPVPAVEGVAVDTGTGSAEFALTRGGMLLFVPGANTASRVFMLSIDKEGKTEPLRKLPGEFENIRVSPDGRRLAVNQSAGRTSDIWVYEMQRDTMSRVTFAAGSSWEPVWSPDGQRIAFSSDRDARTTANIYWQRADGTGEAQRLTESNLSQRPDSWHSSGKFLAFTERNPQTKLDIMILPMEGNEKEGWKPGKPYPFVNSLSTEWSAAFSPDGRWIAYASDETGQSEVYVRPFPGPGGKWQVSTDWGAFPVWSRNGKELLYQVQDGKVMVLGYMVSAGVFRPEKPQPWSPVPVPLRGPVRVYDLSPDGKHIAALKIAASEATAPKQDKVSLFFNFDGELRRIAPVKK